MCRQRQVFDGVNNWLINRWVNKYYRSPASHIECAHTPPSSLLTAITYAASRSSPVCPHNRLHQLNTDIGAANSYQLRASWIMYLVEQTNQPSLYCLPPNNMGPCLSAVINMCVTKSTNWLQRSQVEWSWCCVHQFIAPISQGPGLSKVENSAAKQ